MKPSIYHNPDCGTSRNTLAMIEASGETPEVIEYLKTPPCRPSERVLALLANPVATFTKEDGDVVSAGGARHE